MRTSFGSCAGSGAVALIVMSLTAGQAVASAPRVPSPVVHAASTAAGTSAVAGGLHPALPASASELAARKAEASATARSASSGPSATGPAVSASAPATQRSWQGINDTSHAPSDSTGAIGTTRYVELVNADFALYNRTSNSALAIGSL